MGPLLQQISTIGGDLIQFSTIHGGGAFSRFTLLQFFWENRLGGDLDRPSHGGVTRGLLAGRTIRRRHTSDGVREAATGPTPRSSIGRSGLPQRTAPSTDVITATATQHYRQQWTSRARRVRTAKTSQLRAATSTEVCLGLIPPHSVSRDKGAC